MAQRTTCEVIGWTSTYSVPMKWASAAPRPTDGSLQKKSTLVGAAVAAPRLKMRATMWFSAPATGLPDGLGLSAQMKGEAQYGVPEGRARMP